LFIRDRRVSTIGVDRASTPAPRKTFRCTASPRRTTSRGSRTSPI
jgi:hypothetical protein